MPDISPDESLFARATRIGPTLPGGLARIATYFALHPDRVAAGSALDIAQQADTSDASVVRTARALGYSGMKEMRLAALALIAERTNPGRVLEQRLNRVGGDSHLEQVIDDTVDSFERFRDQIDPAEWSAMVDSVATARRVFCYGLTPTGFIADYLAFMFNRIGVDARSNTGTGVLLADYLMAIDSDDVLIVFAPIRQFDEVVASVRAAKHKGARVVLITEAIGMPIRSEVDHVITTAPTSLTTASDAVLPLAVAQALFLAVAAAHPKRAARSMDRLNELRSTVSHQKAFITAERLGLLRANAATTPTPLPSNDSEVAP